jgi:hypothetical protein
MNTVFITLGCLALFPFALRSFIFLFNLLLMFFLILSSKVIGISSDTKSAIKEGFCFYAFIGVLFGIVTIMVVL